VRSCCGRWPALTTVCCATRSVGVRSASRTDVCCLSRPIGLSTSYHTETQRKKREPIELVVKAHVVSSMVAAQMRGVWDRVAFAQFCHANWDDVLEVLRPPNQFDVTTAMGLWRHAVDLLATTGRTLLDAERKRKKKLEKLQQLNESGFSDDTVTIAGKASGTTAEAIEAFKQSVTHKSTGVSSPLTVMARLTRRIYDAKNPVGTVLRRRKRLRAMNDVAMGMAAFTMMLRRFCNAGLQRRYVVPDSPKSTRSGVEGDTLLDKVRRAQDAVKERDDLSDAGDDENEHRGSNGIFFDVQKAAVARKPTAESFHFELKAPGRSSMSPLGGTTDTWDDDDQLGQLPSDLPPTAPGLPPALANMPPQQRANLIASILGKPLLPSEASPEAPQPAKSADKVTASMHEHGLGVLSNLPPPPPSLLAALPPALRALPPPLLAAVLLRARNARIQAAQSYGAQPNAGVGNGLPGSLNPGFGAGGALGGGLVSGVGGLPSLAGGGLPNLSDQTLQLAGLNSWLPQAQALPPALRQPLVPGLNGLSVPGMPSTNGMGLTMPGMPSTNGIGLNMPGLASRAIPGVTPGITPSLTPSTITPTHLANANVLSGTMLSSGHSNGLPLGNGFASGGALPAVREEGGMARMPPYPPTPMGESGGVGLMQGRWAEDSESSSDSESDSGSTDDPPIDAVAARRVAAALSTMQQGPVINPLSVRAAMGLTLASKTPLLDGSDPSDLQDVSVDSGSGGYEFAKMNLHKLQAMGRSTLDIVSQGGNQLTTNDSLSGGNAPSSYETLQSLYFVDSVNGPRQVGGQDRGSVSQQVPSVSSWRREVVDDVFGPSDNPQIGLG